MQRVLALLFSCAMLLGTTAARADGKNERALSSIAALTSGITSLNCIFEQRTDIPMFAEPVISRGRLVFKKPAGLVWEYLSPSPQGLVMNGNTGFRWEGDRAKRTAFVTGKDPVASALARQMLAWINFDRQWIEKNYTISATQTDPPAFVLTPKNAGLRSVIASLSIAFASDGAARELVLNEAGGGKTSIRFDKVTLNAPLKDEEFR